MADDITKQINEAVAAATEGLVTKNKDLLKELKTAQKSLTEFSNVNIKDLQKAAKDLEAIKKKKLEDDGEYKKLYDTAVENHAAKLTELTTERDNLKATLDSTTKAHDLSNLLVGKKVIPELLDVAVSTLKDAAPANDATALEAFVTNWAESDVGKHFISSGNSGGGADGNDGGNVNEFAKFFDPKNASYNLTQQAALHNKDPKQYEALKKKYS